MLHVLIEAHIQHLVSLVEDHLCHMVEVDAVVLVVVHEAAWGRHHDLTALGEAFGLLFHIRTAVNADYLHFRHKIGQPGEFFSDLLGQLTGGGQNDGLRCLEGRVDVLSHRDAKSAGLASAGRGLGDDVTPGQHDGDGLFLHLGHFRKAHPLYGLVDGLAAL